MLNLVSFNPNHVIFLVFFLSLGEMKLFLCRHLFLFLFSCFCFVFSEANEKEISTALKENIWETTEKLVTSEELENEFAVEHLESGQLQAAAAQGRVETLLVLLKHKLSILNKRDKHGRTALSKAAEAGQITTVKLLMDIGANPNITKFNDGSTVLHDAAAGGNIDVIKFFLGYFSIDERNDFEATPSFFAAREGKVAALRYLLTNGANPYTKDIYGDTLLHVAARNRQVKALKYLCEFKNLINATNNQDKIPLQEVSGNFEQSIATLKLLIDAGSDIPDKLIWNSVFNQEYDKLMYLLEVTSRVNLRVSYDTRECRETILMILLNVFIPPYNVIEFLLDQGADIDIRYCDNVTALHRAAIHNRENALEIIELFLNRGAYINGLDKDGLTPLDWSVNSTISDYLKMRGAKPGWVILTYLLVEAAERNDVSVIRQFFKQFLKQNRVDQFESLLIISALRGSIDVLTFLLTDGGIDLTTKHKLLGHIALSRAASAGQYESVKTLMTAGVDVRTVSHEEGWTALHSAADGGDPRILDLFLKHFYIDVRSRELEPPSFIAAKKGNLEALRFLFMKGADPYTKDVFKYNILHVAVFHKQVDIVKELLRYKALINDTNVFDHLPINYAVSFVGRFNVPIIELLINASSEVPDDVIWTIFSSESYDLVKLIIEKIGKVDVRMKSVKNNETCSDTLLLVLIKDDNYDLVKFILDHGADVNIRYCRGETAMHHATHYYHEDIVRIMELLHSKGADINSEDRYGFTPLDWAVQKGNLIAIRALKTMGAISGKNHPTTPIP